MYVGRADKLTDVFQHPLHVDLTQVRLVAGVEQL